MKSILIFGCIVLFAISCNNNAAEKSTEPAGDSTAAMKYDYPYSLDKPYQEWQPGDQKLAVTVLSALKAYETGDIAACMKGFGDSVDVRFDYFQQKFSNDSLGKFFTAEKAKYSNIRIDMNDWESVISKDGKTQYVTMWYKQVITDKNGKTDSLGVIDDCKMVNGKIVELDQKIQHYPAKK